MRNIILIFLIALTIRATGQTINTDRPTQSASAFVVPTGTFQIETGFVSQNVVDGIKDFVWNGTLLRIGVNEHFELRVSQSYLGVKTSDPFAESSENGFGPLGLGIKARLQDEEGWKPQISFVGEMSLPTGEEPFKPEFTSPSFRFAFQNTLSERWVFGYNLGMLWVDNSSEGTFLYTLNFAYSLSDVPITVFAEPYGFVNSGPADSRFNFGLIYLIKDQMQADISAGFGLSDAAPDNFISLGFSIML